MPGRSTTYPRRLSTNSLRSTSEPRFPETHTWLPRRITSKTLCVTEVLVTEYFQTPFPLRDFDTGLEA